VWLAQREVLLQAGQPLLELLIVLSRPRPFQFNRGQYQIRD
jgi:hypothetical protein